MEKRVMGMGIATNTIEEGRVRKEGRRGKHLVGEVRRGNDWRGAIAEVGVGTGICQTDKALFFTVLTF